MEYKNIDELKFNHKSNKLHSTGRVSSSDDIETTDPLASEHRPVVDKFYEENTSILDESDRSYFLPIDFPLFKVYWTTKFS